MPWLLETSNGKFIDTFGSKSEAESARKTCGILGAQVRSGRVPQTHMLAMQTVTPDDFASVDNFIEYLDDHGRNTYTVSELEKLARGRNSVLLVQQLRARGYTPELQTSKATRTGIRTTTVPRPPKLPQPTGSFKPLPETPQAKAQRRARLIQDVDLGDLAAKGVRESLGKLDRTLLGRQKGYVTALTGRHLKILRRVDEFNETVEQINALIDSLEGDRADAVEEAVSEYNEAVVATKEFIDELVAGAEQYAENQTEKSPDWADTDIGLAHDAWVDQIREVGDDLEEIGDLELPEPPDTILAE